MTDLAFSHNLSFRLCGVCRGLDYNTAPFPTFANTFSSTLHSSLSNLGQFHPATIWASSSSHLVFCLGLRHTQVGFSICARQTRFSSSARIKPRTASEQAYAGRQIAEGARSTTQLKSSHSPVWTAQPLSTMRDANAAMGVAGHSPSKASYQTDFSTLPGTYHRDVLWTSGSRRSIPLAFETIRKNQLRLLDDHRGLSFRRPECTWS
jgi:hypothetical protein